jgi:ribosomal protein S1
MAFSSLVNQVSWEALEIGQYVECTVESAEKGFLVLALNEIVKGRLYLE